MYRLLLALLVVLGLATPAWAAIVVDGELCSAINGSATSITTASCGTAGSDDTYFVVARVDGSGTVTVDDSVDGAYALAGSATATTGWRVYIFCKKTTNATRTITVNTTGGATYMEVRGIRVTGLASSGCALDRTAVANGSGASLGSGNTSTTRQANELILSVLISYPPSSGNYTSLSSSTVVDFSTALYIAHRVVSSTGAQAESGITGAGADWAIFLATFADTPISAGGSVRHRIISQ